MAGCLVRGVGSVLTARWRRTERWAAGVVGDEREYGRGYCRNEPNRSVLRIRATKRKWAYDGNLDIGRHLDMHRGRIVRCMHKKVGRGGTQGASKEIKTKLGFVGLAK